MYLFQVKHFKVMHCSHGAGKTKIQMPRAALEAVSFMVKMTQSVSWPDVITGEFGFVRSSCLGFLTAVGLFCQYHSQVTGWKDSSPKKC